MAAAPNVDMDTQMVENIPRDTLVALLKRKDKDAKASQTRLEKLEERYVKVVRFNKILMEDRTSFQRFCHEILPDSDGIFEEAAAHETAANLSQLLQQLSSWRRGLEAAGEDRKVFQQFVEMVFPGDESCSKLFEKPRGLGSDALDVLQQRWMESEDLHNQSIASINSMAREQGLARSTEIEEALSGKREAERKIQDLQAQLTALAREKAAVLKQRLHGGGESNGAHAFGSTPAGEEVAASGAQHAAELRQLQDQKAAAERREREAQKAFELERESLQASVDEQRREVRRLRKELQDLMDLEEGRQAQAAAVVEEKDGLLAKLQSRTTELEQELSSNDFITRLAEQQAGREVEIKNQEKQLGRLNLTLQEIQRLLQMSYSQEKVLKERIRELEASQGRSHVAGDYLKHVVLKYVEYCQTGDLKAQSLVPVICTLLNLTPAERKAVENPSIPHSLLVLNQAIGGAGAWLQGRASSESTSTPDPMRAGQ
eukprot:TRINITY_DN25460_c0_g1_i1.p1 TRINITY_DN25460_c0_g1~~TRINITY_DN25460_c0_g1_i1.p1  ORF type:complete len:498 (-),score=151.43 TRINITY_DN25460_c0_g1_i1:9-1469(-)